MPTPEKRLRLMQLASSNLPVGGYSWSQGWSGLWKRLGAGRRGLRALAATPDDGRLFTVDLPLFARLYRACEQGDIAAAQRWTAYLLACRETREREEERNRGAAFARLLATGSRTARRRGARCASKASSPAWPGSACAGKSRCPRWP
jgi:urease accessory protein